MFKKLKDKLAEEVKSSPQRIQQFAQAAQAAVTSASSSISDITNSDLFSIGDNDSQQSRSYKTGTSSSSLQSTFQDVSLIQPAQQTSTDSMEYASSHDNIVENQRQRRLSNSSFTSDISFRLPSYESPSMYHLQSDMEVSASEADERGFSGGPGTLDRVTKEQLYAAYRRTQDRYTKYRTQYADLARHYKLLERENAKARSVLVETQDKALRRISELREQCSLEQSAKAHLEKALRVDIEERNMKIEALNTKIKLLQEYAVNDNDNREQNKKEPETEQVAQLINISDNDTNQANEDPSPAIEITTLTNKIEKMEQLLTKYKESLKTAKDKNSQMTTELQILQKELENKNNENTQLKAATVHLIEAKQKIQELNNTNEELQNKINAYDFAKSKEMSTLEIDLQKAQEEISELQNKIEIFTKREEENAISLAENKLSIHKELESKENEIKSLKDNLSASKKEIQSLNIVISDCKNNISVLEEEKSKHNNDINELNLTKTKLIELEAQLQTQTQKCSSLEQSKSKADEEFKCLQLQMKQETAEKLAMIDRNVYLENRNLQLTEENTKKTKQINNLESELHTYKVNKDSTNTDKEEMLKISEELDKWKTKYNSLESEMQEERVELVKLQSEIEKLLSNHELIQTQNTELHTALSEIKSENETLRNQIITSDTIKNTCLTLENKVKSLQQVIKLTAEDAKLLQKENNNIIPLFKENLNILVNHLSQIDKANTITIQYKELEKTHNDIKNKCKTLEEENAVSSNQLRVLKEEKQNLKLKLKEIQSEKIIVDEKLLHIQKEYDRTTNELKCIQKEKADLLVNMDEIANKCKNLQANKDQDNSQNLIVVEKVASLEKENQILLEYKHSIDQNNETLTKKLDNLQQEHDVTVVKINSLIEENKMLVNVTKELDEKNAYIVKLEADIKLISQEKVSLSKQSEIIANNVNILESEIEEVRKSHAEIEVEKDHLSAVIEELENNQLKKGVLCTTETQTENDVTHFDNSIIDKVETKTLITSSSNKLTTGIENEIDQNNRINISSEEYNQLKTDYDHIKEDNKRLQSDIEGLQTYLAKISKENGLLNDKLREIIATSETFPDKKSHDSHSDFKDELQTSQDKIDDLMRENCLLIEENLELKDQLQSQNYQNCSENKSSEDSSKGPEYTALKEKYNNVVDRKNKLEERLLDLEQMNKSVTSNMEHIQENNEKLRLSNDKLERRLDEALVSLRHLHSLQENTELEYLRNILYEYLTGSGTHSVTLAKVLSAIVKFDDMQTQLVLQKEKERQGFLRQLGII